MSLKFGFVSFRMLLLYLFQLVCNSCCFKATLLVEQKFIHNGGRVGHIEDVATRKGFEGMGVGREMIHKLTEISNEYGCYKIILDCDPSVVKFYEKLGFVKKAVTMRLDL